MLVFALDGAGYHELMRALYSGKAPHLQTLLGVEQQNGRLAHGYSVPNALSILPSTTVAAWSSIFTGKPPAQTGRMFRLHSPIMQFGFGAFIEGINTYHALDELPHRPIYLDADQKE